MKFLLPFPFVLILSGCALFGPRTDSASTPIAIDLYAEKADLIMSRAASAVEAAMIANSKGQQKVVESELRVAEAYLPRPSAVDTDYASKRALRADIDDYQKSIEVGDVHQRQLDELWNAVSAEKERSKLALDEKELKYQSDRKMFITYVVTGVGALGVAAGIGMLLFGFNKMNALFSIAIGVAVIAAATVFEAPWFGWAAAAGVATLIIETWRRFKIRKDAEGQG